MAFYSPIFLGREEVEEMYENFLSKYQNEEAFPLYWTRGTTNKKKLQERRDHISGTKRKYQLRVRSQHAREEAEPKQGKGDTQANALAKGRQQTGRQGARCRSLAEHYGSSPQLPSLRDAQVEAHGEGHQGLQAALPNVHD